MTFITHSILHEISRAWLDAWDMRRVAASGLSMSAMTLVLGGAMALARAADTLFAPFAALAAFFVWLWWLSVCIAHEMQGRRHGLRFDKAISADNRAAAAWKFALPALIGMLALSAGGLQSVFPSALGLLLLFPLQWAGALFLLLVLPAALAATLALRLSQRPFSGNLKSLAAWSLLENPRVWGVLAHIALTIFLGRCALDLALWMQPSAARLWSYTVWGPAFGQAPPQGHASVAALHVGILLALLPLQGHLVVFSARLSDARPPAPTP